MEDRRRKGGGNEERRRKVERVSPNLEVAHCHQYIIRVSSECEATRLTHLYWQCDLGTCALAVQGLSVVCEQWPYEADAVSFC